ncbi:MAG: hypothetical protein KF744_12230 [Taibaiella sp.]|nr:hypothetical protein [Taibaiella sp.]
MRSQKLVSILSVVIVGLCLLQVWLPSHYLTCDGPCHLYNARILHSTWTGAYADFYRRFYHISYTTAPNATTTWALALLLFLLKGIVAEKVFLSLYVLLLATGTIKLLQKLQGGSNLWQLAAIPVIFTFLLAKGFYNFSLGVALWPWMVLAWIGHLERPGIARAAAFAAVAAIAYFTHLLPFLSATVVCGCLTLSYHVAGNSGRAAILKAMTVLACTLAPLMALSLLFTNGEGGLQLQLGVYPYRLLELLQLKYLINVTEPERPFALATGIVLTLAIVVSIWHVRSRGMHKYDGFIFALLPIGFVYLFFPEDFMGRAIIIAARVQLILYLIGACIVAYRMEPGKTKQIAASLLLLCFLVMSVIRTACRLEAAKSVRSLLATASEVKPESVVLPLQFSDNGLDENGKKIANQNSLFHHTAQYLGADKPLIVLDNYEANAGYFPVSWLPEANPYFHLNEANGIEGLPPGGNIEKYERETGRRVDYVLLHNYRPEYMSDSGFHRLATQIQDLFTERKASPGGQCILLGRD